MILRMAIKNGDKGFNRGGASYTYPSNTQSRSYVGVLIFAPRS